MNIQLLAIIFALAAIPVTALAQPSDPPAEILGHWRSVKFLGKACSSIMSWVEYEFDADGYYTIRAGYKGLMSGKTDKAKGTYGVSNHEISGEVDGQKMGPFRYDVKKGQLILRQHQPVCTIWLESVP